MKKIYYITILAVILTILLQARYIVNVYDNYINEQSKSIEETIYISLDKELNVRSILMNKDKFQNENDNIITIKRIEDITYEKFKEIKSKKNSENVEPLSFDIDELRAKGIVRHSSDIVIQFNQENYLKKTGGVNLQILDSVYISYFKHDFSHVLIKYDSEKEIIDTYGNTTDDRFNYISKLFTIGLSGKQFIQIKANIPMSDFIKDAIWTVVFTAIMLVFVILCLLYQLTIIKLKTKTIEAREVDMNGIIHDLKSPLNSILAMMEWFSLSIKDTQSQGFIKSTKLSVRKCVSNIESLLNTGRYSQNNSTLDKTRCSSDDLGNSVSLIKNELSMIYSKPHSVTIENKLPADEILYLDIMQIESVIRNLIENALKYSDDKRL